MIKEIKFLIVSRTKESMKIICNRCEKELTALGGLAFSPPYIDEMTVSKHHLCQKCYDDFLLWMVKGQELYEGVYLRKMLLQDLQQLWDYDKQHWKEMWYPENFFESVEATEKKLMAYPNGCWLIINKNHQMLAYGLGHPWIKEMDIVALDAKNVEYPSREHCDCFYIHDVCVHPALHKSGFGTILVKKLIEIAKENGFTCMKLVSVLNSDKFWEKFGFITEEETVYGNEPAKVMIANI